MLLVVLACCYADATSYQDVAMQLWVVVPDCCPCHFLRLLVYCGWLPGCCYIIAKVSWVVAKVLLCKKIFLVV